MRYFEALVSSLVLTACSSQPAIRGQSEPQPSNGAPLEFLLTAAAGDFHTHRPYPARFRDVRLGYVMALDGTRQYMLCGAFLPDREDGKHEWIPFVTIKTSGYEQWLGARASDFCLGSSIVWVE